MNHWEPVFFTMCWVFLVGFAQSEATITLYKKYQNIKTE